LKVGQGLLLTKQKFPALIYPDILKLFDSLSKGKGIENKQTEYRIRKFQGKIRFEISGCLY
jgi:hypothetical protein